MSRFCHDFAQFALLLSQKFSCYFAVKPQVIHALSQILYSILL
nr:MAG TPA: hypothetical protein [Caudoviricetes sp.]